MKVFVSIGNEKIEEIIREADIEIIDCEDNLDTVYDMMDFTSMDALIINRLLDDNGNKLVKIAEKAKKKNIKVVVLTESYDDYEERKVVTALVNENVTAFIKFRDLSKDEIEKVLKNYPEKFDFGVFSDKKTEYREIIKTVFKKVVTVYSPTSEGASTTASHLAHVTAEKIKCKVCLMDFNILKPNIREIFKMDFDHSLKDLVEVSTKKGLSPALLESCGRESKYVKGLDVIPGMYDLNEIYSLRKEEFEDIIEKAKFNYDFIIIDTNPWYDLIPTDRALYFADEVIVPVRGRKASLDTVNRYFENFERYNDFDTGKFRLIINNYTGNDLTSVEIEAMTKYPILGYISRINNYGDNGFKNRKLLKEYNEILKSSGLMGNDKKVSLNKKLHGFGLNKKIK